jgi:hypothetical protein
MARAAQDLLTGLFCLHEVSKDLDGELLVLDSKVKCCSDPGCQPLTLVQHISLRVGSAACNSTLGAVLDGSLRIGDLTTVFTGPGEHFRGMHAGNFYWRRCDLGLDRRDHGCRYGASAKIPAMSRL